MLKKIVIAAAAALFACAVQANDKPASPAAGQQAAAKQLSPEECRKALEDCGNNAQCKENLQQNGCR